MGAKAPTAAAEIAAGLRDGPGCDSERFRFGGDIEHPHELPVFQTLVRGCLADGRDEVTPRLGSVWRRKVIMVVIHAGGSSRAGALFLLSKLGELHTEHREGRVRPG